MGPSGVAVEVMVGEEELTEKLIFSQRLGAGRDEGGSHVDM